METVEYNRKRLEAIEKIEKIDDNKQPFNSSCTEKYFSTFFNCIQSSSTAFNFSTQFNSIIIADWAGTSIVLKLLSDFELIISLPDE